MGFSPAEFLFENIAAQFCRNCFPIFLFCIINDNRNRFVIQTTENHSIKNTFGYFVRTYTFAQN